MPGIFGIISKEWSQEASRSLGEMARCLADEPFHSFGTYASSDCGIGVGWSCPMAGYSDCLPIWNETKDVCLVFTGEHFGPESESQSLKAAGHDFTPGNASTIVHLYESLGPAFVERLNGWFSGLLIDFRQKKTFLFNDRFGMNRLYFHEDKDGFYFASEAKCLLRVLPSLRQLDQRSLGEFLSCGCVLENRSLFPDITLIPGGSIFIFSDGNPVTKTTYFRKESWENQPILSAKAYYQKLKETWHRILPLYFRGPGQAALSLTGGVDSRLILACAPCPPGSLSCYSFGGMYRACADVELSRAVASLRGQPHQTVLLDRSFFSNFPALAEQTAYLSDGTMDCTGTADLFVNRLARQIAPIRITGLNGGEVLRRVIAFKAKPLNPDLFTREMCGFGDQAASTYQAELGGNLQSFVALKQSAWHLYPRLSIERSQICIRSPYFDNEIVALSYQAPQECVGMDPALRLIAESAPELKNLGTDRAVRLNPIPIVTWAHHQFQEFTFKAEYAYDAGMPHWLARLDSAFKYLHFERLFLGRHKFYHYRLWYRDALSNFLKEVLLDPRARSRPYLNGKNLEKLVVAHANGRGNYTGELHRLLTLELAQRQLLERS